MLAGYAAAQSTCWRSVEHKYCFSKDCGDVSIESKYYGCRLFSELAQQGTHARCWPETHFTPAQLVQHLWQLSLQKMEEVNLSSRSNITLSLQQHESFICTYSWRWNTSCASIVRRALRQLRTRPPDMIHFVFGMDGVRQILHMHHIAIDRLQSITPLWSFLPLRLERGNGEHIKEVVHLSSAGYNWFSRQMRHYALGGHSPSTVLHAMAAYMDWTLSVCDHGNSGKERNSWLLANSPSHGTVRQGKLYGLYEPWRVQKIVIFSIWLESYKYFRSMARLFLGWTFSCAPGNWRSSTLVIHFSSLCVRLINDVETALVWSR